ncbi:MAG TPA: hypothetical protein EYI97_04220 [Candidatus Poseidoniales archaeon]|nr:hypothetical protein [Candidatus Poseidoniales archaeon]
MATLGELHLHAEHVDREWEELTGEAPECIAFLSRHKSASGRPSLTVHPVGNWGAADYGGTPGAVSGTAPEWMTGLLLAISRTAPAGYQACFEATHHGPLLETPAFFVEIGSDESRWELREPAEVLARALLELKPASGTPLVGIGGGHYTPRFSDVALLREACFGHMVPKYALEHLTPELLQSALEHSGARAIYLHRKGMPKSAITRWREWAEAENVAVVSSQELPKRA